MVIKDRLMFKIFSIILYTLSTLIISILNINLAFSQKQYSKEEIIKNARILNGSNNKYNCFYLSTIKLEEAGFITLHFRHNNNIYRYRDTHKNYCPENVLYDVKVYKENFKLSKIIGAKGVNGRNTDKNFLDTSFSRHTIYLPFNFKK